MKNLYISIVFCVVTSQLLAAHNSIDMLIVPGKPINMLAIAHEINDNPGLLQSVDHSKISLLLTKLRFNCHGLEDIHVLARWIYHQVRKAYLSSSAFGDALKVIDAEVAYTRGL